MQLHVAHMLLCMTHFPLACTTLPDLWMWRWGLPTLRWWLAALYPIWIDGTSTHTHIQKRHTFIHKHDKSNYTIRNENLWNTRAARVLPCLLPIKGVSLFNLSLLSAIALLYYFGCVTPSYLQTQPTIDQVHVWKQKSKKWIYENPKMWPIYYNQQWLINWNDWGGLLLLWKYPWAPVAI